MSDIIGWERSSISALHCTYLRAVGTIYHTNMQVATQSALVCDLVWLEARFHCPAIGVHSNLIKRNEAYACTWLYSFKVCETMHLGHSLEGKKNVAVLWVSYYFACCSL